MPVQTSYGVKDGKVVMIQKRCSVDEFMRLKDRAFDDKPVEIVTARTDADKKLLGALGARD